MKNLHLIPTDKPSLIAKGKVDNLLAYNKFNPFNSKHWNNQNIYITSDEEIKEGDWFYLDDAIIVAKYIDVKPDKEAQKIILTTDQDLIKDGVQAIDDEFLEWFVKNPSCEWVEVEKQIGCIDLDAVCDFGEISCPNAPDCLKNKYKIIIPKEEPTIEEEYLKDELKKYDGIDVVVLNKPEEPKQETLEEAAHKMLVDYGIKSMGQSIGVLKVKNLMVDMAKWQAERMYSEKEVLEILEYHTSYLETFIYQYIDKNDIEVNEEWFEQFKKK